MVSKSEILIVEDDAIFRHTFEKLLVSKFPFLSVASVMGGIDAFKKIKSNCPDIIFMDIELPGLNGLGLTKKIKDQYPHAVIIILTNHDLPEYRDAAFQNGADHFLSKETTKTNEILELVESIVNIETNEKGTT